MRAADVMTRAVLTVSPDTKLLDALTLMLDHRVSGLPVIDADGTLCGLLTEGDLLHRTEAATDLRPRSRFARFLAGPGREAAAYVTTHSRRVGDLMTQTLYCAAPSDPLDHLVRIMEKHHVRRVPILDAGKLVGIVSRADLLRLIRNRLAAQPETGPDDAQITQALDAEIRHARWIAAENIRILADHGTVTLDGTIFDERLRGALRVAAANTPGVTTVEDHLVTLEPATGLYYGAP